VRREIARITESNASDPALAMDAWRAVLDAAPQDVEALGHLYALAEGAGQWASVIEAGQALAERLSGPARGAALRRLGEIATQHVDPAQGVSFWEQAIVQIPPDVPSAVHLEAQYASVADGAGRVRALEVQAAYAEDPTARVRALTLLAQSDLERRDRDGAAARYLAILAVEPEQPAALRFLATYLVEQQRLGEALPVFDALAPTVADGLDVDDPDVRIELAQFWCTLGEMRQGAGRADDAIAAFEHVLALNASHAAALEALGGLFVSRQDWSRAEPIYRQWLQVIGTQADKAKVALAYTQLGFVERALNQREKAEKRFVKALELAANFIPALKGQAQIAADKGDWNGLLNTYNTIIYQTTVPAEVIEAYMTKGRVLDLQMGRPDKAAQHYNRSLDFDPNQPGALALLGELALRAGDFEAAGGHFERGLALEPSSEQARVAGAMWAGLAHARRGGGQDVGDAASRAASCGDSWGELASGAVEAVCEAIRAAV
jgi:tetratricopeptide (TPR) repeat protein